MEKYQATTKILKNNLDVANVGGLGVKTAKKEAKNWGQNDSGQVLHNCFLTPSFCPSLNGAARSTQRGRPKWPQKKQC